LNNIYLNNTGEGGIMAFHLHLVQYDFVNNLNYLNLTITFVKILFD